MNQLITIHGVRGFIDQNGIAQLNLEDVSRGLGFTQQKHGVEYIRWERVNGHLNESGFSPLVGNEFIPENVFYRLAMKADNNKGRDFQAKVADEILPSIRKHGVYMTPETIEKTLGDPDFIIGLATKLKEEQAKTAVLQQQIVTDKPKVLFAESLETSQDCILIANLAKLIKQNGVDTGEKRLYRWLRENGYLGKVGDHYNMPTQRSMDMRLFEVKTRTINNPGEEPRISKTTVVTGRGQVYFINKFINQTA
jgi:anti-repressor protein